MQEDLASRIAPTERRIDRDLGAREGSVRVATNGAEKRLRRRFGHGLRECERTLQQDGRFDLAGVGAASIREFACSSRRRSHQRPECGREASRISPHAGLEFRGSALRVAGLEHEFADVLAPDRASGEKPTAAQHVETLAVLRGEPPGRVRDPRADQPLARECPCDVDSEQQPPAGSGEHHERIGRGASFSGLRVARHQARPAFATCALVLVIPGGSELQWRTGCERKEVAVLCGGVSRRHEDGEQRQGAGPSAEGPDRREQHRGEVSSAPNHPLPSRRDGAPP